MKVFYRPELTAPSLDVASPSARKPALVNQDWLAHGLTQLPTSRGLNRSTLKTSSWCTSRHLSTVC